MPDKIWLQTSETRALDSLIQEMNISALLVVWLYPVMESASEFLRHRVAELRKELRYFKTDLSRFI